MSDYKKIILKNSPISGAVPLADFLDFGEIALNYADKKLYYKNLEGNIVVHETPYIDINGSQNSVVKRNADGSGIFNGIISNITDPDLYAINASHSGGVAMRISSTGNFNAAEILSNSGIGAEISSISGIGSRITSVEDIGAIISSEDDRGAKISSVDSIGAEISSTSGIGAKIYSQSNLGVEIFSTTGSGAEISSQSSNANTYGLNISTSAGTALISISTDNYGAEISSSDETGALIGSTNGTGAIFYTLNGNYCSIFGREENQQILGISAATSSIDWFKNNSRVGKLKTTSTISADRDWTLPDTTGTIALLQNNLGQFASTTSSQLASVISDETGSGALVFASSPTLTTPTIATINGSTVASGTLTLRATSSATKGTSGVLITDDIASASSTTGSLVVTGGIGASGSVYAGGDVYANNQILATKAYVDTLAEGLHVHAQAHVILNTSLETITGGAVSYNNGTDGVGAFLTLSNPINFSTGLEGDTDLSVGARIIVNGQSQALRNGIYVITSTTQLTRAEDFDTPLAMAGGDFVFVTHGSTYANTGWVLGEAVTSVGVSPVNFIQFSGAGIPVAGAGLVADGLVLNAVGTSGRVVVNADSIDLATTGVSAGTYENVTVDAYGRVTGGSNTTFDSSITGSGKTFTNLDDGKIFHISGTNTLTLPSYASASTGWSIGFVNVGGGALTLNIAGGSGNTINASTSITNTVAWSSVYVYKSDISGKFIALGVLY